ncbi:hypothetical protein AB0E69_21805 [Kribbella sp. NPDC026611]|uniref:hypothetical protein n=1 Tax=Kribbella sp. NPDC026611 TaxID=3154911 RepID=UPI0034101364
MTEAFQDRYRGPSAALPGQPRQWIEDSLRALTEEFGDEPLRRPAVVPDEFVPSGYDGSEDAAREVCLKVSERMGISPERIRFSFQLEKVAAAARIFAAVQLGQFVAKRGVFADVATPEDIEAVMVHSQLLKDLTPDNVVLLTEGDWLEDGQLLPELRQLAFYDVTAELTHCRGIAAEPDPERRAELARQSRHRLDPAADPRDDDAPAGRWLDLSEHSPGFDLLPGYTAVLLNSRALVDPTELLAVLSHELAHEALRKSPLVDGAERELITDLYAIFQGFGIAHVNASLDERAVGDDESDIVGAGYLGEHLATDALASWRFHQHLLVRDGGLVPSWYQALDPVPRARFLTRLDELPGAPLTVLGW